MGDLQLAVSGAGSERVCGCEVSGSGSVCFEVVVVDIVGVVVVVFLL